MNTVRLRSWMSLAPLWGAILLVTLYGPNVVAAPQSINMEVVAQSGGVWQTALVDGDTLFASEGTSLIIYSLTDPADPTELGRVLLPDSAWDTVIDGDFAFVASLSAGLSIVDISDLTKPAIVGTYDFSDDGRLLHSSVYSVAIRGDIAYLGTGGGVLVLDISDKTIPTLVTDVPEDFRVNRMVLHGNYAYLAGGTSVLVLDISNPEQPVRGATYTPLASSFVNDLAVANGHLYTVNGTAGLDVASLSNQANPIHVGRYPGAGFGHSGNMLALVVSETTAYVADGDLGLMVFDLADDSAPSWLGSSAEEYFFTDVAIRGSVPHLYLVGRTLTIFEASQVASPMQVGQLSGLFDVERVAAQEGIVLAADRTDDRLMVYEITDTAVLQHLAQLDGIDGATGLALDNGVAYVAGGPAAELKLISLQDPTAPAIAGRLSLPWDPSEVVVAGQLAFVGVGPRGIVSVNAANPAAPQEMSLYGDGINFVNALAHSGGNLFVADGNGMIQVLGASQPTNLNPLGSVAASTMQLAARDSLLASRATTSDPNTHAVALFDVSDPTQPRLVNQPVMPAGHTVQDLALVDRWLYVLTYRGRGGALCSVRVYDVAVPNVALNLAAEQEIPGFCADIAVHNDLVFVAAGSRGMIVTKLLLPRIEQVEPPFGPAGWANTVTIDGTGFATGISISAGVTPAIEIVRNNETSVEALLPPSLVPGTYDITASNPGGAAHTLRSAYEVVEASDEGLFARAEELLTDPPQARATESADLSMFVHRRGGMVDLTHITVDFYDGHPNQGNMLGTGMIATLAPDSGARTSGISWTPEWATDHDIYAVIGNSGIQIKREIQVLPSSEDPHPPIVQSVTINGATENTTLTSRDVSVRVSASDQGTGVAWVWATEYYWHGPTGSWQVAQDTEWIPYETIRSGLPLTLSGTPGTRFIDVWVADYSGNISVESGTVHTNYRPASNFVAQGQAHIFAYTLGSGAQVRATLNPSGDADLYIGNTQGWLESSRLTGSAVETINFSAPADDFYSFMAYGFTSTTYSLTLDGIAKSSMLSTPKAAPKGAKPPLMLPRTPTGPPRMGRALPPAPSTQLGLPDPNQPLFADGFETT